MGRAALDRLRVIYVNERRARVGQPAAEQAGGDARRQTYVTQCAACYGDTCRGPVFPALVRARRTPEQVTELLRAGLGRMPSFAALPPQALSAVAQYVLGGEA